MVGILEEKNPKRRGFIWSGALCSSLYVNKVRESQPVSNGLGVSDMLVSSSTNFGGPKQMEAVICTLLTCYAS